MASLKSLGVAAAIMLAAAQAAAAEPTAQAAAANPGFDLADSARIDKGKARFAANCAAYCHGSEGVGGRAASLKGNPHFSPAVAYKTIAEGRRGGSDVMPPWEKSFSPEQIWELVAYLKHLSVQTTQ